MNTEQAPLTECLKSAGLSATHPRRLVLQLLQQQSDHLSADEVYRRLVDAGESIGIASVYRILAQFENAGLVSRHQFDGTTAVYELERGHHHDHLICQDCGEIVEFIDEEIEQRQRQIASELGFTLADHALTLFGRCQRPDCENRKPGRSLD
jgi:Fur family transcriptional regulator, ferric uptake regulator